MPQILLFLAACAHDPTPAVPVPAGGIVQSPLDRRAYEVLTLDNGLRALLISDPDTDMAAASLRVQVGHYADPPDRQGLAHFLEHMLFMGTDRYPEAGEYRAFVEAHGGQTNAGTAGERTQYYFQIEHEALSGAFERFARFFVAPLLDPAYVDRERNAVNSEYSLKKQDNFRRGRQVRKATTNPAHPESKFSVGSLDTLADRPDDPVYEDLRALWSTEYRADRMTVAVIGRESLDQLRELVRTGLADVANPQPAPAAPVRPAPFRADQLGVRIDIVPLDVRREIELQFPLPPEEAVWPRRPIEYVNTLLGHEGEGTLFAALKAAGWIETISTEISDPADDYDVLSVNVGLTEAGAGHVDEIVAAVFADLDLVRKAGPESFRVYEDRTMRQLGFRFAEEIPPVDAVRAATDALHQYPADHVLDAWAVVGDLDEPLFRATLDPLTPENLRLVVTLPGAQTDQVEPLYDVPWALRPFTAEERATFRSGPPAGLSFSLPPQNPYLPEDVRLAKGGAEPVPARLSADDRLELWHLQDTSFGVPRARVVIDLWSADPRADARARTLVALLDRQLDDALQEFRYPLALAGVDLTLASSDRGLTLAISGYNDGIEPALSDLVERVARFRVDPARFPIVKARAIRDWQNQARQWPIQQARRAESETLYPYNFQREAALALAADLTDADLQAFADQLFDGLSATMFVHGNVTDRAAQRLARVVTDGLLARGSASPIPLPEVRRLGERSVVREVAVDHADSSLVVSYQGGAIDALTTAKWLLLGQLLDTPFFEQLRTQQQLGYNVYAGYTRYDRLPGVVMALQSGVAGPGTLLERVDAFLAEQRASLPTMDPAEFATYRDGLVAKLRERDTQLYARSDELLDNLRLGITTFDWNEQLAVQVEGLDRDTMATFARENLDPQRGRLIVRSFGRERVGERDGAGCPDVACTAAQLVDVWTRPVP